MEPRKQPSAANPIASRREVRVLIVDDHPVFRRGLAQMIGAEKDFKTCGEAADAAAAMKALGETSPDLITVDLSLATGSGLELIKQIRAVDAQVKILVCTMHEEKIYGERAIRAGADGYLNKEEAPESIITALRRILDGKMYMSDEMAERLLLRRLRKNESNSESPPAALSDRELEVFELIGHGLSSRRIATKLGLSAKTVDTHREHIKDKLGAEDNAELVRRAVEWVIKGQSV